MKHIGFSLKIMPMSDRDGSKNAKFELENNCSIFSIDYTTLDQQIDFIQNTVQTTNIDLDLPPLTLFAMRRMWIWQDRWRSPIHHRKTAIASQASISFWL